MSLEPPGPTTGGLFLLRSPLKIDGLDPVQLEQALKILPSLPPAEQRDMVRLLEAVVENQSLKAAKTSLLPFVKRMWPGFIVGPHHRQIANAFERIARGELKRVTISLPPRAGKSELSSYLFPSWYLGQFPEKKVMQASHKTELAVGFGRKVRNLVGSEQYSEVFPDVGLRVDSKAAGRWNTNHGGSYYATGVGAGLAGFGADLLIIDDPHDEQEAMQGAHNPEIFAKAWDWYQTGPRQRLQPGAAIVVIATRWSKVDLIGKLTQAMIEKEGADKWEVIEIPAIMPSGNSYWPEYWSTEELLSTKANIQPVRWNAQYMQQPTGEEGAIVKRDWWKRWTRPNLPECEYVIQSWDTAFRATTRSNYSVCTTMGVWRNDDGVAQVILLDVWRDRVEFPELKKKAIELYREHNPDACLVEAKANGDALINEMRQMGIPVTDYTPSRGQDKIVRLNAVADLFASGIVWAPNTRWADDMIEEMAEFPYGANDDQVDAMTLGLMRFRQGHFLRLESDEEEEELSSDIRADYYV